MSDKIINWLKMFVKKYIVILISLFVAICSLAFSFYYVYSNRCSECEVCETISILEEDIEEDNNESETINTIKVDVKGAVKTAKVYELPEGSIVSDAIILAGGINSNGTLENINLSKKLNDEMVIYVFTKEELEKKRSENEIVCEVPECKCETIIINECIDDDLNGSNNESSGTGNSKKVSINTASLEELLTLDGIGESKAKSIIEYREQNGKFHKIEDIMNVSGIAEEAFEKIKDYITL